MKRLRIPALAAGAVLTAALAGGLEPDATPVPSIGAPAPEFRLAQLQPPYATLASTELKGRVWLLNVWASWCAACKQEHALLLELARDPSVPLYGLNYQDDARAAREWLLRLGDPYAASLMDADGRTGLDYGVEGLPQTFVIDRAGIVRFRHTGTLTRDVLERELAPLLRQLQG